MQLYITTENDLASDQILHTLKHADDIKTIILRPIFIAKKKTNVSLVC